MGRLLRGKQYPCSAIVSGWLETPYGRLWIQRRPELDAEGAQVENEVIEQVLGNWREYLHRQRERPESFGDRYFSADEFKEAFEQFGGASLEQREPQITMVWVPPETALEQAWARASSDGRIVTLRSLPDIYQGLARSLKQLQQEFGNRLSIRMGGQQRGAGRGAGEQALEFLHGMPYSGYRIELLRVLSDRVDQLQGRHQAPEVIYRGFRG